MHHRTQYTSLFIALVSTFASIEVQAQKRTYHNYDVNFEEKLTVLVTRNFPTNIYINHDYGRINQLTPNPDYNYQNIEQTKPSFNFALQYHTPLYQFTDRSNISIITGVETFKNETTSNMYPATAEYSYKASLKQSYWGIPIGFAYKYRTEASFIQDDWFSLTVGASVMPSIRNTTWGSMYKKSEVSILPKIFVEAGVFIGMQVKVHVAYYPKAIQDISIHNIENLNSNFSKNSNVHITSDGMFQVGIGIMPFSASWKASHW